MLVVIILAILLIFIMVVSSRAENQENSNSESCQDNTPITSFICNNQKEVTLWSGKHPGISYTTYQLTNQRIIIQQGALLKSKQDIELFAIQSVNVIQSLSNKLLGKGTIKIYTVMGEMIELEIYSPYEVKEMIRNAIMELRGSLNISYRQELR